MMAYYLIYSGAFLREDNVSSTDTEHNFAARYAAWAMRNRILVIMVVLITTVVAALQIKNLDVRNDPDTLLPATNRYVATNAYGEQKFGMGNLMVLGFILKEPGDIYQPWFVNLVKDVHEKMVNLPNSRGNTFMDLAAQKIKYMGAQEGSLVFKRLIPTSGISEEPNQAKEELALQLRRRTDLSAVPAESGEHVDAGDIACEAFLP